MATVASPWSEQEKTHIRCSLASILASSLFSGSPRQQRFLDYLVAHTLAGEAHRLKGYTIAVEVFDRENDFDSSLDAIVRVEATRLRNKLREYYDTFGQEESVRIELPKGSYGLEITVQKMHLQDLPLQPAPVIERRIGRQILPTNIPRLIEDRPSLVVLPFTCIGTDNAKEYFAEGVVDSLIAMFSRLSGLFVISRISSFSYKNTTKTSEQIAVELGVRYLLEGSVQHAGNQVRITAQLVDAKNGGQVWSDRYDRELKDIFALQDDITQNIVRVLQIKLAGEEAMQFGVQQTHSIEAHDCLLQGIAKHRSYTEKATTDAIALYKKALVLDSNYAAAHAWLARALCLTWSQKWSLDPAVLSFALTHSKRAVEIDPQSTFAISILGWVHLWLKNREDSIAECRRAVALDPNNAEAHLFLSMTLSSAGLGEEALYYIEKALRFSPVPDVLHMFAHGICYFAQGHYAKAIDIFARGRKLNVNFKPNHFFQMIALHILGRHSEVQENLKMLIALDNGSFEMPNHVIWTDETLAVQQVKHWDSIMVQYFETLKK